MTEIRIRNADSAISMTLGDIDFTSIDDVIPMLRRWGIYESDSGEIDVDVLNGSFRIEEGEAYFEVTFEVSS
ncbi:hypothetical protein [Rhodococcus erythropolis]|uniref:hypothetical protein n=1 Tax=Rhodococcus erythropolis TaxID=1833 RepID=UPI001BE9D430|nr:hypothetical protein [Rhodococcus erythropolis]MBT2265894.1 hypothetical protein [Rhodococcus erythropolis]